jgi:hypothetical protein
VRQKNYLEAADKIRATVRIVLDPVMIPDLINIVLEYLLKKKLQVTFKWSAFNPRFSYYNGTFDVCIKCVSKLTEEDPDEDQVEVSDAMLVKVACKLLFKTKEGLMQAARTEMVQEQRERQVKRAWRHLEEDDPVAEEKESESRKKQKTEKEHVEEKDDDEESLVDFLEDPTPEDDLF